MSASVSGLRNVPCSMESTPAWIARLAGASPWQCAAALRPQACASCTIASISAWVSCGLSMGSPSDSTPPDGMNLTTLAPYLICQRTAARHSSGPLQTPRSTSAGGTRWGGNGSRSAWPPREPIAYRETNMRGPGTAPLSMALRNPRSRKSAEPRSRTVVNPASSVRRAYSAAYCACSAGQRRRISIVSRYQLGPASKERWVWASIRPGSKVTSPRSITCAPAGGAPPTREMRLPSTTTSAGCTTAPVRASNIRAAFSATGLAARTATSKNMKPPIRRSYHTGPEASNTTDCRGYFGLLGSFDLLSELLVLGAADGGLSMPASRLDPTPAADVPEPMVLFGVVAVDDPVVAGLSAEVPVVGDFSVALPVVEVPVVVLPLITPVLVSVLVPVPTVVLPVAPVPDWPVGDPLTVPAAPVRVSSVEVPVGPAEAPVPPVLPVVLVPVLPAPVCAKAT